MANPLFITEILETTCAFATKRTLAHLAQTCRAFEGPSLEALWKELESIDHLVCLLPDSIWEDSEDFETTRLLQLPSEEHWKRLRRYTSHVTTVNLSDSEWGWGPVDNRRILMASLRPPEELSPIFPNVNTVVSYIRGNENWAVSFFKFPWLHGTSVTEIDITLDADETDETVLRLVGLLGTLFPNVRRASVFAWPERDVEGRDELIASVSEGIRGWKHLEYGSFNALDTPAYEHLARSEHLTSLRLNLQHTQGLFQQEVLPTIPFPALSRLNLIVDDLASFVRWIRPRCYSPLSLGCATLSVFPHTTLGTQILDFCNAVLSQLNHRTLQELSLRSPSMDRYSTRVQPDSIRPHFAFTYLRSVILSDLCTICMDDAVLQELASAWPFLEVLLLNCHDSPPSTIIAPTFRGFFRFVENCPRLRELSILIDTRSTDWVHPPSLHRACNYTLSRLVFGRSPIDNPERVAEILRAVLPHLEEVDTGLLAHRVRSRRQPERPSPNAVEEEVSLSMWNDVNTYLTNSRSD